MPISKRDVEHIALLARLDLTETEKDKLTSELGQILEHAAKISEIDTVDVEPTSHAVVAHNVWREDRAGNELTAGEALENAPVRRGNAFAVPKIT